MGSGRLSTCAASRLATATGQALPGRTSHACRRHPTHLRCILILAVGLLPIARFHSLRPLKRHSHICCMIAISSARPFIVPTQEAFWHLPCVCYLYRVSIHCAHSRGILIIAVRLLPIARFHSLCPLKRHSHTCRGTAAGSLSLSSPLCPTKEQHCQLSGHPLNFHSCSHC